MKLVKGNTLLIILLLASCGGGGNSNSSAPPDIPYTLAEAKVVMQQTQSPVLQYDTTLNYTDPKAIGGNFALRTYSNGLTTYRWNIERDGLIPVKMISNPEVFNISMDRIEAIIGHKVFDRTSLLNIAEQDVYRGILIRNGAVKAGATQNSCGLTTTGSVYTQWIDGTGSLNPLVQSYIDIEIAKQNPNSSHIYGPYQASSRFSILVDLTNTNCGDYTTVGVHELGHALGLWNHFDGFGFGQPESGQKFASVLKLLYNNPPGTPFSNLK